MAQTAREYLFSLGLTKAPTGRGRFSNEAKQALTAARAGGMTFSDDPPAAAPKKVTIDVNAKAVRKWANENGHSIPEKGRISGTIKQAYLDSTKPEDRPEPAKRIVGRSDNDDLRPAYYRYSDGTTFTGTDSLGRVHKEISGRNSCSCGYSLVGHLCDNPTALVATGAGVERIPVTPNSI